MTRIGHQNLTSARRTGTISYDRTLEFLVLYNNNPVPLYVRLGSPEIPNETNYDIAVPPNYIMAISVNSNQFGFRLGNSAVVLSQITGNTVIEATIDEAPPSLGGVPINNASLSTADLLNGVPAFSDVTIYGPFNINQWGGLIVNVIPTATSGQGVIQVDISADGLTFIPYQTWAFWSNIPATILIPRVSQFVRITLNTTFIVGEPIIAGNISIRGSLTEITTPSYTPQGTSLVKPYALGPSASQQYSFVTTGFPAVSIAAIATAGSGINGAMTLLVEASSDLVNWRQVTFRTQKMSIGLTLYRALGNLDLFMRISIIEAGGVNNIFGSVYLSIPREPDLGAILNTIQQSLGDTGAPANTNQDMYHELDNIRTGINTSNTNLGTVNTNLTTINTNITTVNTNLTTIQTQLSAININITSVNTNLGTIITNQNTMITNQNTIITDLTTINTSIGTGNASLATLVASQTRALGSTTLVAAGAAAGAWVDLGAFLIPGNYITAVQASFANPAIGGGASVTDIYVASGPFGVATSVFYATYANAGGGVAWTGPMMQYEGLRYAGWQIPANHNHIFVQSLLLAGNIRIMFVQGG